MALTMRRSYKLKEEPQILLSWFPKNKPCRVTWGKSPPFQQNIFFSQKLSEIFQFCKVHIFTRVLGHIQIFFKMSFCIREFSYSTLCPSKKKGQLAPCTGQVATPCGARRHPGGVLPLIVIFKCNFKLNMKYIRYIFIAKNTRHKNCYLNY